ncbi:hypothetical protein [Floridanema aerugineum]|uniref:Uncharacterized protein n=1 Tax=Floridaenema aerugineum BLCC-F46 TaxID=3153654 RepID=A0ABV4X9G2_9CYAN
MSIKVWPFLVSRNRMLDYRTVVAPDFICNAGIAKLLARVAEDNLTERGYAIRRRIEGSDAGDFTIVFRVIYAREKDINPNGGNEVLKDSFGREIDLLEGVVFKEVGEIDVKEVDLDKAHKLLTKSFKDFWGWKEPHSAIPSEAFSLELNTSSRSLKIEDLSPFHVNSKIIGRPRYSPRISLVKILVFTTVALILLWFLLSTFNSGNVISSGLNPKVNSGNVVAYTTFEKKIEFPNQKAQGSLSDLPSQFPNSAIFLSGNLNVKSQKEIEIKGLSSNKKQTISLSGKTLKMKYQPFNRAIAKLLEEQASDGTVTATIIQPDPNGIPPRLCFDWS